MKEGMDGGRCLNSDFGKGGEGRRWAAIFFKLPFLFLVCFFTSSPFLFF